MPLSDGTKEIATNPGWGSATTKGDDPADDRIDPDDATLTPPVVIANGWPSSFSTTNTPRRKVFNELFYREHAAIKDVINFGLLPWDTDVNTLEGGIKQVNGVVYRAIVDNGPAYSNATDPTAAGQTVWATVSGSLGAPTSPNAPTADAGNGQIDWSWNCPLDNGAPVTSFDFQWREQGTQAWTTVANLTNARYLLTGLTNGTTYEARVRATNTQGDSAYGANGDGTATADLPSGGAQLALRAVQGSASQEVDLDWLEPDDGGSTITSYAYQWKSGGQNYNNSRRATTTNLSATVGSLTDGTSYDFRVRAINSVGNGPQSNEASATPAAPVTPPTATVPGSPDAISGTPRRPLIVDWTWDIPNDNGGEQITSYEFQWRFDGDGWSNANLTTGLQVTFRSITIANANRGVQARARAVNSVGNSGWRTSTVITAADLDDEAGLPTQRHRFTTSQTWNWPYDDLERAVAVLYGTTMTTIHCRSTPAAISLLCRYLARRLCHVGRHYPMVCDLEQPHTAS